MDHLKEKRFFNHVDWVSLKQHLKLSDLRKSLGKIQKDKKEVLPNKVEGDLLNNPLENVNKKIKRHQKAMGAESKSNAESHAERDGSQASFDYAKLDKQSK